MITSPDTVPLDTLTGMTRAEYVVVLGYMARYIQEGKTLFRGASYAELMEFFVDKLRMEKKALLKRRLKRLTGFEVNQSVYGKITGQAYVVVGLDSTRKLVLRRAGSRVLSRHADHLSYSTIPPKGELNDHLK